MKSISGTLASATAIAAVAVIAAACTFGSHAINAEQTRANTAVRAVGSAYDQIAATADERADALATQITDAKAALASIDQKTLDADRPAVAQLQARIDAAAKERADILEAAKDTQADKSKDLTRLYAIANPWQRTADAHAVHPAAVRAASIDLSDVQAATDAVRQRWDAEQARIAAEKAAAAAAAAAAAQAAEEAKAAAARRPSSPATVSAPRAAAPAAPPRGRSAYVGCVGLQAAVDACASNTWTLLTYGLPFPTIGEHEDRGGAWLLSVGNGATITVTGKVSGTYQVIGSTYIPRNGTTDNVRNTAPGGTDLAMQTCAWNHSTGMRFVYLHRIG